MNHTKVLVGLILFATANIFAMEDITDDDSSPYQGIIYKLNCGVCNELVTESTESKRVFHRECMKTVAGSDYVTANPVSAPKPWKKHTKQRIYGKHYYWKKKTKK